MNAATLHLKNAQHRKKAFAPPTNGGAEIIKI
jgi:hypothetical protein